MLTKATMLKVEEHEAAYGVSGTHYFGGPEPMRKRSPCEGDTPAEKGAWVRRWSDTKGMYEYVQKE